MIAGIVVMHKETILTRNIKQFGKMNNRAINGAVSFSHSLYSSL